MRELKPVVLAFCTVHILNSGKPKWKVRTLERQHPWFSILKFSQPFPSLHTPAHSKMLQRPHFTDDPFSSLLPKTPPSTTVKWANQLTRPSRFSGLRLTPLRIGILLLLIGFFVLIQDLFPRLGSPKVSCGKAMGDSSLLITTASEQYRHWKRGNYSSSCLSASRIRIIPCLRYHRYVPVLQIPQYLQCLLSRPPCTFQSPLPEPCLDAHCHVIRRPNWTRCPVHASRLRHALVHVRRGL